MGRIVKKEMRNGYCYGFDKYNRIVYIKNPNNLEMWLDDNEKLVRAKWKDGYEQLYQNDLVTTFSSNGIFKSKLHTMPI